MTLPRIVVSVAEHGPDGWLVDIRLRPAADTPIPAADAMVDVYEIGAVMAEAGGVGLRVPVVPKERLPLPDAPHHDLCTGDVAVISALLDRLTSRSTEPGDVTAYGRWLFECLLAPAWAAIRTRPEVVRARGVELALEWPVDATDLHRLVWEAMHDGDAPLAGHHELLVAITRLVPVLVDPPTTVDRIPRVLFAVGAELTDPVIRPGAMFMGLIRAFDSEGVCISRIRQQVTITDLAEECARFQPDIVHLVAHGTIGADGAGVLVLGQGSAGGTSGPAGGGGPVGGPVGADSLSTALATGGRPLAVVLSACQSGAADGPVGAAPLAAQLVGKGVPMVSAMAGEVSEQACRLYTRRFVESLHEGEPVVEATAKGRRAALLHSERPADQLDWAMPAIFLARSVEPSFRAIDPAPTRALIAVADELKLRQQPVFIGRSEILQLVEDLFADNPTKRLGFVGVVREGPLGGLGGTRLLREIGFRLLRAGHVPLLLGPYSESGAPTSLRTVLVEILQRAIKVSELLDTLPPPLTSLGLAPDAPEPDTLAAAPLAAAALAPDALAGRSRDEARIAALETLSAFARARPEPLDPQLLPMRLWRDLGGLIEHVAAAGPPFGPHSSVVILGDEAHAWTGALEPLLAMIGPNGLGRPSRRIPVIVSASLVHGTGPMLRAFRDERSGLAGYAFPELTPLAPREATLGFQWVLLHPWRRDADRYRNVYTSARSASAEKVHESLQLLNGLPTEVRAQLYLVAELLRVNGQFDAANDERAYADYVENYP